MLPPPTETVKAYQRRFRLSGTDQADESALRFDDAAPVQEIVLTNPDVAALSPDAYEVIGEKVTYRLAQRPGAYVILKYRRPLIKRKDTEALSCPPAPPAVFEKSVADVSVLAGLLIDKFLYHLPLYRQHQRLQHAGIRLSRGTLTQWVQRAAELLEPIYYALLSSILQSHVLTMDEPPIKAGRREKGKLHKGYLWPLYGDKEEVAFPFAASRAQAVVREALGNFCGVLLTDGYILSMSALPGRRSGSSMRTVGAMRGGSLRRPSGRSRASWPWRSTASPPSIKRKPPSVSRA